VYYKPALRRAATVVETSYGSTKKEAYEVQTREAVHLDRSRSFSKLTRRPFQGRWMLVEFPQATQTPPKKITVRG